MKPLVLLLPLAALILQPGPVLAQNPGEADWRIAATSRDLAALPDLVAGKRRALVKAASSGNLERIAELIYTDGPFSLVPFTPGDPLEIMRARAPEGGDAALCALLLDILDAPYIARGMEDFSTSYIWPYLAEYWADGLDPRQTVDAHRILGAQQVARMENDDGWRYWGVTINQYGAAQIYMPWE